MRYEDQELKNDRDRTVIDAGTLSPRFSTVYDIKGDGRQLITFNAGRFFVQTAQQLVNTNLQEDWNGASNTFDLIAHVDSRLPGGACVPLLRSMARLRTRTSARPVISRRLRTASRSARCVRGRCSSYVDKA